ncbi:hypothetical protein SAMN05880557_102117 [Pseudacidovorax sp. RU35E]|nr:hypothetical protein SAMN05880557_102117 [Pseudacidovorax sp. RU35E]
MKQIFPDYIRALYYYVEVMSDDEIADFYINDARCREALFGAMRTDFDHFGQVSKQRVLDFIEFVLSSGDIQKYWGYVVPQEVALDEVEDKVGYLRALYEKLAEHEPPQRDFGLDVELVDAIGPHGINVRQ